MRCLVTGGAGFIGSHLVDRLIELGHEVIVLDDLSTGDPERVNPKADFFKVDISVFQGMQGYFEEIDWVFHLAALARIPRSIENPLETHQANVNGTLNVLRAADKFQVKKVVYSSSSSVYGDRKDGEMIETLPTNPKSPYALQKLMGEMYCRMFSQIYKLPTVCLRYFNVYGPRQATQGAYKLAIQIFMEQSAKGEPITVFGDGEQTRDYTWVHDVVTANILAAQSSVIDGDVFNIGSGKEVTMNTIARMFSDKITHIIPNPRGEFEEKRKFANNKKAKEVLDWQPTMNVITGLKSMLKA